MKYKILDKLAPSIAWGIRILFAAITLILLSWYFGVGWMEIKDVFIFLVDKMMF